MLGGWDAGWAPWAVPGGVWGLNEVLSVGDAAGSQGTVTIPAAECGSRGGTVRDNCLLLCV